MTRPADSAPTTSWVFLPIDEVARRIAVDTVGRPTIVAVDGRSGAGKSTFAERLVTAIPDAVLVHGDDLSWHEPLFGWEHVLREGVLAPLHRGEAVEFTPPSWPAHGRNGAVVVASDVSVVVIEGVGVAQRSVAGLVDVSVWVESDDALAEERGLARDVASGGDGDPDETLAFWRMWTAAERTFLAADRPWERADWIVAGNLGLDVPTGMVAVARQV